MKTTKWITTLFSQLAGTGIGTDEPHTSAALAAVNTEAGLLIPRMTSTPAPNSIPYFPKATDCYYCVVQVDASVLDPVSLSTPVTVTYEIVKQSAYTAFIDVVLVIK